MLRVADVEVKYGEVVAVRNFSMVLGGGDAVCILGTNGAGKTSCVEAIVGLLPKSRGTVEFDGTDITVDSASSIVQRGIALVPQLRELFFNFTVEETLHAAKAAAKGRKPRPIEDIYSLFPGISSRRKSQAGNLSGGEQQMLAIGRALVTRPRLLILDEPSSGLASGVVSSVVRSLQEIRHHGLGLILVEQNLEIASALSEKCIVMSVGNIVWEGSVHDAVNSPTIRSSFFV
jgi:branched-chain amino acid transport system ATP-binding protein